MEKNFKSIAALFLCALSLVSFSSCLDDNDDDAKQKSEWYSKIVNKSVGRYNAKYSLTLLQQQGTAEKDIYLELKSDDKSVYLEFPIFPLKEFAPSITVPTVIATAGTPQYDTQVALRDSIQALKTALANAGNVVVKAPILTSYDFVSETDVQFIPVAPVQFELSYAVKTGSPVRVHKYILSQEGAPSTAFGGTPRSLLRAVNDSHSVLNVNLIYWTLRDVTIQTAGGTVKEFTPTQLFFKGN